MSENENNSTFTLGKDDILEGKEYVMKDDDYASTVNLGNSNEEVVEEYVQEQVQLQEVSNITSDNIQNTDSTEVLEDEKLKKKGKNYIALSFAMVAVAAVIVFALIFITDTMIDKKQKVTIGNESVDEPKATILTTNEDKKTESLSSTNGDSVADIVDNVMPSIVSIICTVEQQFSFFGNAFSEDAEGSGSGIIIGQNDKQVLIATNNHVIDGAKTVKITFNDGEEVEAEIKGTDSSNDLAVVSVDIEDLKKSTKEHIKIASIGKSENCKVGETAIAIGNALGYGQSVTVGVISAMDRSVATEDYNMELIQTDAAINPGNSGGALLNAKGEVIGINSVKYVSEDTEGMGYAIPITEAVAILNELMNYEDIPEMERAYLGIVGYDIDQAFSERSNVPVGVYVQEISKNSPAQKCGLQVGDVIIEFAGKKVKTMENIQNIMKNKRSGEKAEIKVMQASNGKYKEKTYTVTFGSRSIFMK